MRPRLDQALRECARHALRMGEARRRLDGIFPLTPERWHTLTSDMVEHTDQLIYRFTKLQDALGRKVFPRLMAWLGEDVQALPFLDLLDRLERLGVLESADAWQQLREVRNILAQDYEEEGEVGAASLNLLHQQAEELLVAHDRVVDWIARREATTGG